MDGRFKRLVESLDKIAKEGQTDMRTLSEFFHNEETCVWDDPTSREKTKKAAADIKKQAAKQLGTLKVAKRRYTNAGAAGQRAATEAKNRWIRLPSGWKQSLIF